METGHLFTLQRTRRERKGLFTKHTDRAGTVRLAR